MVIEFFGVSGSGKTSGARQLSSALGLPFVKGGEGKLIDAITYAVLHPARTIFFLSVITRETARTNTWRLFRWRVGTILGTFALLSRASRARGGAILDEGLLQRVLSVYERVITQRQASRIVRLLSPQFVVYITDTQRQFQRYDNPDHPRRQLGEHYMETWKEIVRTNTDMLYRALRELHVPHVAVDDSYDAQIAHAVAAARQSYT